MKQSTSFSDRPDEAHASAAADASRGTVVPSLLGSHRQAALDRVREVGLVPAVDSQEVDDEDLVGVVCTQHPDAGTELPHGGVVLLLIGQLAVAEESAAADEPGPVEEEDDWFDIELPGVDQSVQGSSSGEPDDRGAQSEGAMSHGPQRLPAGSEGPAASIRPRRRAVVVAIALAVIALLVMTARSCGQRPSGAPSPASSVQHEPPAPRQLPERRPPRHVPSGGSTREQRPSRNRMARRRAPLPRVPPLPVASVPEPPRASAPAPSDPDHCEFCLEQTSP